MDVETISNAWEEFARLQSMVMSAQQMLSAHKAKCAQATIAESCYATQMETAMVTSAYRENAVIDLR